MSRWGAVRRSIKVAGVTIILLVVSLLTMMTIMAHRHGRHGRQRAYNIEMRMALVDLAVAESLYFSEHDVYTTNLDTLALLLPYPLSRIMMIEIDRAGAGGWHATIAHPGITQTCSFGADGPPVPRPEPADLHQFCSEDWEYRTKGPEALVLSGVHLDIERENGTARYVGETMLITSVSESGNGSTLLNYDRTFTNHVIQVETTLVGGTDNNWQTVMCRWTSADNYYEFGISADGYFLLDVWVDGRKMNKSLGPTRSRHIRLGRNVVNVLRAECVGNTLRLSVNGHVLAEIDDDNYASGAIGVSVVSLGDSYSQVSFDNLVVTTR